jgi:hypothetical protein
LGPLADPSKQPSELCLPENNKEDNNKDKKEEGNLLHKNM